MVCVYYNQHRGFHANDFTDCPKIQISIHSRENMIWFDREMPVRKNIYRYVLIHIYIYVFIFYEGTMNLKRTWADKTPLSQQFNIQRKSSHGHARPQIIFHSIGRSSVKHADLVLQLARLVGDQFRGMHHGWFEMRRC